MTIVERNREARVNNKYLAFALALIAQGRLRLVDSNDRYLTLGAAE